MLRNDFLEGCGQTSRPQQVRDRGLVFHQLQVMGGEIPENQQYVNVKCEKFPLFFVSLSWD